MPLDEDDFTDAIPVPAITFVPDGIRNVGQSSPAKTRVKTVLKYSIESGRLKSPIQGKTASGTSR